MSKSVLEFHITSLIRTRPTFSFWFLFVRQRRNQNRPHPLGHSPSAQKGGAGPGMEPGARNVTQASHANGRNPNTCTITTASQSALARSWSWELNPSALMWIQGFFFFIFYYILKLLMRELLTDRFKEVGKLIETYLL